MQAGGQRFEPVILHQILRRRVGREVEGTPLLRERGIKNTTEGSNPSFSAKVSRSVVQRRLGDVK